MFDVFITKAAKFLPNSPVQNDDMEKFLGQINETASKARRLILRNNQITSRHYALDQDGNSTHNNAEMTREAVQGLFGNGFSASDMELLSCGTSTPDNFLPSHAAMVHGLLKNRSVELNSSSGVCCAGMNSLKYGYLSVKAGNTGNAVCTGSEKVSTWMVSDKYEQEVANLKTLEEQPIIAFKKDFLRWMLSDGAGAVLLQNQPNPEGISLRIDWMDFYSYAHELEACMYAGGDKMDDGSIKPWSEYDPSEWLNQSLFSIKQDVKLLDRYILEKGAESMVSTLEKNKLDVSEIDFFLPHVSSHYFVAGLKKTLSEKNICPGDERWFMNLHRVGNVGSASIYLALEELLSSGKLQKGHRVMLSVPESGRFSFAYAMLTVV